MMTREDWRGVEYGGVWARLMALIIDGFIISFMALLLPFGNWAWFIAPIYTLLFWMKTTSSPGKMVFGLVVVDKITGTPASTMDYAIRYVGYWFSGLIFGLGYIWAIF